MTLVANAERIGRLAIAEALRPEPEIDLLKWAESNITFPAGEARPGPYDRRSFRYFDEILRALGPNDPARVITLMASAQIGKTAIGNIFALGAATVARGAVMVIHPTIEGAARWSRMKLSPLMRSIPSVAAAFPQRARDAADSILYKESRSGLSSLLISGANSPASLSQVSAQFLLEDDLSKWEATSSAGDPEAMADSRARAFEFGKIFKISTPLTYPTCKITRNFEQGSREQPTIACVHCGHRHTLEWPAFHFEQPNDPFFVCPACGGLIFEHHRSAMLDSFKWIAENPAALKTHRSFRLWSAYSVLQSWSRIAAEYARAQGDGSAEQVFWTDTLGLAYRPKGEATPPVELAARASRSHYCRSEVPEGALVLTLGCDCQLDRVEWLLLGHGEHYRKFVIDCGVVGKHISEPDAQRNLDLLLQRQWSNFRGRKVGISMAAVDAGFSTDDVLSWASRHSPSKVIAVRGIAGDAAPRLARVQRQRDERSGVVLKYARRFFNVGTYSLKSSLYRDLAKTDAKEKGFISFPNNLPLAFYEDLVSERRVAVKRMGAVVFRWEKSDRQRNEMHDCFLYATAAGLRHGVNFVSDQGWARLRAELEAPAPLPEAGRVRRSMSEYLAR